MRQLPQLVAYQRATPGNGIRLSSGGLLCDCARGHGIDQALLLAFEVTQFGLDRFSAIRE